MRHLVMAVFLALLCSACLEEVAPEAGAEDATVEAAAGLGDFDPGGIGGGDLNLGGGFDLSGPRDSSGWAEPLATLTQCYAVARAGRESREAFCRTVPQ